MAGGTPHGEIDGALADIIERRAVASRSRPATDIQGLYWRNDGWSPLTQLVC